MDREGFNVYGDGKGNNKNQLSAAVSANNPCPQLPGTVLRIYIPAGFVINLLNLFELTSPSGICLILRVPLLEGSNDFANLLAQVQGAGGSVQVVQNS